MTNTSTPDATPVVPFTDAERETFFQHYVICALWSSNDDSGEPLDAKADADNLLPETAKAMREDCNDFIDANLAALRESGLRIDQMGHDFWLTRNGHGAGFWDRGIGKLGDVLTAAAKTYGSCDLFIDEDGRVGKA